MKRLRYEDAAKHLGISVPTLKLWVRDQKIPYYKIGLIVQFDIDDLDKFIESARVEAA